MLGLTLDWSSTKPLSAREAARISPSVCAWLFQNRRLSEHALTPVCTHARCPSRVLADICMFFYPINSVNIQLIHAKEQPPQVHRAILDSVVCGAQELGLSHACNAVIPSVLNFICFSQAVFLLYNRLLLNESV